MSVHTHSANAEVRPGPSNTRQVEESFVADIRRRFRKLRGLVRQTVSYENDALGLSANADPRERFDFESRETLTLAFIRWLRNAVQEEVLEPASPVDVQEGRHWITQYIKRSYVNGVNQATGLLLQQGVSIDNIPDSEIPTRPIHAQTLRDLYQRSYGALKSLTDDMVPQVRETLTTGFAQGWNPRKMATELTGELRDLQKSRAETIARSETMNAHSSAAIRQYEEAGATVVSHSRWDAANDARTCPFCDRLNGVEITLDEAKSGVVNWAVEESWTPQPWRLKPPAHPSCRCLLRPVVGGTEPTTPLSERIRDEFGTRADVRQ